MLNLILDGVFDDASARDTTAQVLAEIQGRHRYDAGEALRDVSTTLAPPSELLNDLGTALRMLADRAAQAGRIDISVA